MRLIGSTQNLSMHFVLNKFYAPDNHVCLIVQLYCSSIILWKILMGLDIMNWLILINFKLKLMLTKQPLPSKNRLARSIQILQVSFLQDLQDLVQNLASLALKMKLFLQDMKNLARILQENFARKFSCKILIKSCKKIILQFFLARFLQDFLYLARKASFLVQDLQDLYKI